MRVDLILADRRGNTFEAYAAHEVLRHFEQARIECKLIYWSDGGLQDYLSDIQSSPPEWTLSFTNFTPWPKPLCDMLSLPHFFWMEGAFSQATPFLVSTFGKVGISDRAFCQKLATPNVVCLPHGVREQKSGSQKIFDCLLFADLISLPFLEKTWEELFSSEEIGEMRKAMGAMNPFVPHFLFIEQYLNAQKTCATVKGFKEVRLEVFGAHAGERWLVHLPENIHLHTQLSFAEHFNILSLSKIALIEESSQWYWPAIAAGCLPLPPEEEQVRYYLAYPAERERSLEQLRPQLLERTWEKQINHLIKIMS